jgi:hypothetical protein
MIQIKEKLICAMGYDFCEGIIEVWDLNEKINDVHVPGAHLQEITSISILNLHN